MKRGKRVAIGLGVLGAAGGLIWRERADLRAIAADPEKALLDRELSGRSFSVTAADGTKLGGVEFGPADAQPIVLLHGWTANLRFWTHQVHALSEEHRVIAYDMRGHGESEAASGGDYSIDALADDLEAVLADRVEPGQRAVLAGHSMGGMTIVAWAGRHAEAVRERACGAALINTGMGDLLRESLIFPAPKRFAATSERVGRGVLAATTPLPRRASPVSRRITRYVALSSAAGPAAVAFTDQLTSLSVPAVRGACGVTLSNLDLYDSLAHLDVPAIVIAGGRDRLTPPVHAERMAQALPDVCSFVVVPHSGHMTPLTDADVVTRELRALVPQPVAV